MSRSAVFWQWYASVSDDVRHQVVERGWFEREVTADIDAADMPVLGEDAPERDRFVPDPNPNPQPEPPSIEAPEIEPEP